MSETPAASRAIEGPNAGVPVVGVVAVVRQQERYLVIRRGPAVVAPGAWCFVGGAVESGESQPDALRREFCEEVGGRIEPLRCIWHHRRLDGGLELYWWVARLMPDPALCHNPAEVAEIRWCTAAEIEALENVLESNRAFLAFLKAHGEHVADANAASSVGSGGSGAGG